MLNSGGVVALDLGIPSGREAGLRRCGSEVLVEPEESNGLGQTTAAQCQHIRAAPVGRIVRALGNVGSMALTQIRETLGLILDLPT